MKRKNLFLTSVLLLATGLTACGGGSGSKSEGTSGGGISGNFNLTVWCAEKIVDLTKAQLAEFTKSLPEGTKIDFDVKPVSESQAAGDMVNDVEKGADIYCFAQDQLARLVTAGAIAKVSTGNVATVKADNDAGSVAAATVGENLYAYPLTADNGYFMYYDNTVVQANHVGSLTDIIADVKAAGKRIAYKTSDAWYNYSFFYGAGADSIWTTDTKGNFIEYTDTYNAQAGLKAVKAMYELTSCGSYIDSYESATAAFEAGAAVAISGTWDYAAVKASLGDKFGVAELPTVKVGTDSFHLGSFSGYKLVGVKPQSAANAGKLYYAHQAALYLTNATCQLQRFNQEAWGPSNKTAQANEAVASNDALVALNKQNAYAKPQGQFPGDWWNAAKAIGTAVQDLTGTPTDAQYTAILKAYSDQLSGFLDE